MIHPTYVRLVRRMFRHEDEECRSAEEIAACRYQFDPKESTDPVGELFGVKSTRCSASTIYDWSQLSR